VLLGSGAASVRRPSGPVITDAFRRAGIEVVVASSADVHPPDSFDLLVAIGDPRPAGLTAITMGLPLLPARSPEHLIFLVERLDDLAVRRHWVPRLRLNETRTSVVFSNLEVRSTATAVPIDVHDRRSNHRFASLQFRTRDPFDGSAGDPLERCVGEHTDGGERTLPPPNNVVLTMRPCGRRERLRVIADSGRYSAVADQVELGPARAISIVESR
jgi:hypothetical protein